MTAQSSSRVLNLLRASQQAEQSGSALSPALFQSPVLNRSFILKHRLRQDEVDDFDQDRFSATKIVFPIDPENLGLGGKYVFIDQRGFEPMLADAVGIRDFSGSPDVHLLRAPHLFIEMGDLVSMLEHTTGFWRYRSKEIDPQQFIGDDYLELLGDLREGLGITSETAVRYR